MDQAEILQHIKNGNFDALPWTKDEAQESWEKYTKRSKLFDKPVSQFARKKDPDFVMRAKDIELDQAARLYRNFLYQPKLNGVRAVYYPDRHCLLTRNGNEIQSCNHIIDELKGKTQDKLDGELYIHGEAFQVVNGLVATKKTTCETRRLEFHVFDTFQDLFFDGRRGVVESIPLSEHVKTVPTCQAYSAHEVKDLYQSFLDNGFEGLISRRINGSYEPGKSNNLFRTKPTYDLEAVLEGFCPSKTGANSDTFGSLLLRLPNGKKFRCSGLSSDQRKRLWATKPKGQQVTIEYSSLSIDGIPQMPTFKDIRSDIL